MEDFDELVARVAPLVEKEKYDFEQCATRSNEFGAILVQDVVAALLETKGNISSAAKLLGRRRTALHRFVNSNANIVEFLDDMEQEKLDLIEELQFMAGMAGDLKTGQFLLKTKGKDRGYTTRTEQTGKDGTPLMPPSADYSKMSKGALKELRDAMINAAEP